MAKLTVSSPDGTPFLFEGTADELSEIVAKMVQGLGTVMRSGTAAVPTPEDSPTSSEKKPTWTEQSARQFWRDIYGDQKKVIQVFLAHGGSISYEEFQKRMGYGGQRLSGILSPLTRNAQRATGHIDARVVDWHYTAGGVREYFLDSELLRLLQQFVTERREAE